MTISHPPPSNAQNLNFAQLLRLAMDYGLGKPIRKNNSVEPWTEKQLADALTAEFLKRNPNANPNTSKENTIKGWLHEGKRPLKENHLLILISVLTKNNHIDHSDAWRTLFIEKGYRRKTQVKQQDLEIAGIFPRGKLKDKISKNLQVFFKQQFANISDEKLQQHLSADHALDIFEKATWVNLPDGCAEQAMHVLIVRSIISTCIEQKIKSFVKGEVGASDQFDFNTTEIAQYVYTSTQAFSCHHFLDPQTHPCFDILKTLVQNIDIEQLQQTINFAFYRELLRNQGYYWRHFQILSNENHTIAGFGELLQLKLHKAAIQYETKRSLFAGRAIDAGEPMSLSDIYVDIPCVSIPDWKENSRVFDDKIEFINTEKITKEFCATNWSSPDITERILILRGDPGAGKSSVLKMLASNAYGYKGCENVAILFVPFQKGVQFSDQNRLQLFAKSLMGFTHQSEPIDIIEFVKKIGLNKLLIFFDGLDELGNIAAHESQVRRFSKIIKTLIDPSNPLACKFIISGRDQAFNPTEFEIDLLKSSYRLVGLAQERIEPYRQDAVIENRHISYYFDLRPDWLEKYSLYKSLIGNGVNAKQMLKSFEALEELTKEPLLLFLLSRLAFVIANRDTNVTFAFEQIFELGRPGGMTKADIYSLLIASIRVPQHRNQSEVERPFREGGLPDGKDFENVLTCMAIPVWHSGTGRRGTIKQFFEVAQSKGLLEKARRFTTAAREEDSNLLNPEHLSLMSVFYFDALDCEGSEGDEYEFTHKSFASYLTARAVFTASIELVWAFQQHEIEKRDQALLYWIELTRLGFEEPEILRFLILEIDRYNYQSNNKFLEGLGDIGETTKQIRIHELTVDVEDFRAPFEFIEQQGQYLLAKYSDASIDTMYRHCLVHFFAVWMAFVRGVQRSADESYDLKLVNPEKIFRKLSSPIDANELDALYNAEAETSYFSESLSSLNLSNYDLSGLNLINGCFRNSNLENAHAQLSTLDWSEFENCLTSDLAFISCQLQHTRFFNCDQFTLVNSTMRHGLIEYCKFNTLQFNNSECSSSRFLNCKFTNCQFNMISFEDSEIEACVFTNCTFYLCLFDNVSMEELTFGDCEFKNCSTKNVAIGKNVKNNEENKKYFPFNINEL